MIRAQVLSGKRLVGEAHVHHSGGMSFGSREIDEASFSKQVNFAAVLELVFIHERADFAFAGGHFFESRNVDLHVEEIGRASCRERVETAVAAGGLHNK